MGVFEVLKSRGFISQCTDEERVAQLLNNTTQTIYLGVDPSFSSLHIGHSVPFYALSHLYRAGHRVISLMGGGTGCIGDPSGKTEMRKLLPYEEIKSNIQAIKNQLSRFFDFSEDRAIVENNGDWLLNLNYIEFLRTVGSHFSVNRMLSFESYKQRLEKGLSFIEFNYQLLQSYDFYMLNKNHRCHFQIGGDDQWGNIVAGIDLIRRMEGPQCYGFTCPLITTADGKKMGKSEKGALFLSPDLTSPYDFFQYWRNVHDQDVTRFLLLFTFLSEEECQELGGAKDTQINYAKERLAYEVTKQIHGEEEAEKAQAGARALFAGGADLEHIPHALLSATQLDGAGVELADLLVRSQLCKSKSEARRMIQQDAVMLNNEKVSDEKLFVIQNHVVEGAILLRVGKKKYFRFIVE
ncbi:MAG: tyrosine--tRNA ligase [Spirochaetia bacterium]